MSGTLELYDLTKNKILNISSYYLPYIGNFSSEKSIELILPTIEENIYVNIIINDYGLNKNKNISSVLEIYKNRNKIYYENNYLKLEKGNEYFFKYYLNQYELILNFVPVFSNKFLEKQFNIIQRLLQREDVEEIYNAGDSGREGEYIQRLVFMMAKPNPNAKIKRVWIDSQTEEEIKRGINEAKDEKEYDSLSDSAYLRAKEDYLIGINFSRLLSIIYGKRVAKQIEEEKASISVGRVMTCVLGMIVEREREIKSFVKTPFYKIIGEFGNDESTFKAEWKVQEKSKMFESYKLYNETGFKKIDDAKEFIISLKDKKPIIEELKKQKSKENAPLLFDLGELQNECTKRFKIKPSETLEIIQELYEKKLVTYPRTDARVLSTAVAKEIKKNLNGIASGFKDDEIQG